MTNIPANTVSQEDLAEWYRLQEELKKVKASEMLLRQKIRAHHTPRRPRKAPTTHRETAGMC